MTAYESPSNNQMVAYFTNTPPDSGSTHHITSDLANVTLSAEETIGSDQVYVGNGQGLQIYHTGLPRNATVSSLNKNFVTSVW